MNYIDNFYLLCKFPLFFFSLLCIQKILCIIKQYFRIFHYSLCWIGILVRGFSLLRMKISEKIFFLLLRSIWTGTSYLLARFLLKFGNFRVFWRDLFVLLGYMEYSSLYLYFKNNFFFLKKIDNISLNLHYCWKKICQ